MERKIGEIFEFGGEWYQCVNQNGCCNCAFYNTPCYSIDELSCNSLNKKRKEKYIFKKLEKVGEPYEKRVSDGTFSKFQMYKVYDSVVLPKEPYIYCNFIDSTVEIEIKQPKDMGERDDIRPYDEYFSQGTVSDTKHLAKSNLKLFDIQKAIDGKPVCTRNGKRARIICFDAKGVLPIIALVESGDEEKTVRYSKSGRFRFGGTPDEEDLMMLPEKKERWVNVYHNEKGEYWSEQVLFSTKKEAIDFVHNYAQYVTTVKVSWEE